MAYIEVNNVSKVYPGGPEPVRALAGISMTLEKGEFIAVTGPSGCGKSTLLHTIDGLSEPTSGTILFRGEPLYPRSKSELAVFRRREVGIVYQFFNLVPYPIQSDIHGQQQCLKNHMSLLLSFFRCRYPPRCSEALHPSPGSFFPRG